MVKCNTLAYYLGFEGSEETEKPESNNAGFYSGYTRTAGYLLLHRVSTTNGMYSSTNNAQYAQSQPHETSLSESNGMSHNSQMPMNLSLSQPIKPQPTYLQKPVLYTGPIPTPKPCYYSSTLTISRTTMENSQQEKR